MKALEDGTYLASIKLPDSINGTGRSLMVRFYPKTQSHPLASVALDYEYDGSLMPLAEGIMHGSVFEEIVES